MKPPLRQTGQKDENVVQQTYTGGTNGGQELQVVLLADTDVAFCPSSAFFSHVFLLHMLETHDKLQYNHKLRGAVVSSVTHSYIQRGGEKFTKSTK